MKYQTRRAIALYWPFVVAAILFAWMLGTMYRNCIDCERMGGEYGCRHVWVELVDAEGQKDLVNEMRCVCARKDQK